METDKVSVESDTEALWRHTEKSRRDIQRVSVKADTESLWRQRVSVDTDRESL